MNKWLPLKDYPDLFEVSDDGLIRNKRNKKILKQYLHKHGYYHVATRIGGRKGKAVCFKVHREVAKAFLSTSDYTLQVNHKDCDKTNNKVTNLEWATPKENMKHAFTNGLIVPPNVEKYRKLTEEDVKFIRKNYIPRDKVFGQRALGRKYSVCKETIKAVVDKVHYR